MDTVTPTTDKPGGGNERGAGDGERGTGNEERVTWEAKPAGSWQEWSYAVAGAGGDPVPQ